MVVHISNTIIFAFVVVSADGIAECYMVFSEKGAVVAGLFERFESVGCCGIEVAAVISYAMLTGILSGEKGCTTRATHRGGAEGVVEVGPHRSETGKVFGFDEWVPVGCHVVPAHLVGIYDDDVVLFCAHLKWFGFSLRPLGYGRQGAFF